MRVLGAFAPELSVACAATQLNTLYSSNCLVRPLGVAPVNGNPGISGGMRTVALG